MKLRYVMLAACALVAVGSARAARDGINAIRTAFPFAVDGDSFDSYDTGKGGASASDYEKIRARLSAIAESLAGLRKD